MSAAAAQPCFGVRCPTRAGCAQYWAVEHAPAAHALGTCDRGDGSRPLFRPLLHKGDAMPADVMIDLETMGNSADAAIVAVGAVEFDVELRTLGRRFYQVVDLQSSVDAGGVMDPSTVLWWLQQNEGARAALLRGGQAVDLVLDAFGRWLREVGGDDVRVWGNGAAFDNVILGSAYRRARRPLPWKFWNDRCYRTLKSLHPDVKLARAGTHHVAVDDAAYQAEHLLLILSRGGAGA